MESVAGDDGRPCPTRPLPQTPAAPRWHVTAETPQLKPMGAHEGTGNTPPLTLTVTIMLLRKPGEDNPAVDDAVDSWGDCSRISILLLLRCTFIDWLLMTDDYPSIH